MGFYNRMLPTVPLPVVNQESTGGFIEPLDTLSYGGSFYASVVVANNVESQLLGAPPAGYVYRLQGWGMVSAPATAAGGTAILVDGSGDVDLLITAWAETTAGFSRALYGQLAKTALSVGNLTGQSATFWLRYDPMLTPFIQ